MSETIENTPSLDKKALYFIIATWFWSGLLKPAPGTWGTLFSLPFAVGLYHLYGVCALALGTLVAFGAGMWAAEKYEKASGEHDSSAIVIDETAGLFVACFAVNGSILSFALAFLLFRFFDVLKPWPIGYLDKKIDGALGVMIDDIVAGVFAALCLWGIYAFI